MPFRARPIQPVGYGNGLTWPDWGDADWKPDLVFWKTPQGRLKGRAAELEKRFEAVGMKLAPLDNNSYGSAQLTYDKSERKVCQLTAWYPWSVSADYFGLVDSTRFAAGAERDNLPFLAVIPMRAGNWRASIAASFAADAAEAQLNAEWLARVPVGPLDPGAVLEPGLPSDPDCQHFSGASYRAANWVYVGQTQGRGRQGPGPRIRSASIKDVYVLPLHGCFREQLCRRAIPRQAALGRFGRVTWSAVKRVSVDFARMRGEED